MSEPRTEAGKAMLLRWHGPKMPTHPSAIASREADLADILAIEAEAALQASPAPEGLRAALRAEVKEWRGLQADARKLRTDVDQGYIAGLGHAIFAVEELLAAAPSEPPALDVEVAYTPDSIMARLCPACRAVIDEETDAAFARLRSMRLAAPEGEPT